MTRKRLNRARRAYNKQRRVYNHMMGRYKGQVIFGKQVKAKMSFDTYVSYALSERHLRCLLYSFTH